GLGQPLRHDGPRLPGDHRARVWPLRRPGARPQGAQARPLVYALQNGARAGGGRVRGAADALGVGEVSAHVGAGGAPGEARRPPRVVGMDQGTGLVHIAPGHGEEDYELGRSLGLPIFNPVDDDGRFVPGVERFAGLTVWEANPKIIDYLRSIGMLIAERTLDHT